MRLFVPACGDRLMLAAPWSFHLALERRNVKFAKARSLVDQAMREFDGYSDVPGGYSFKQVDVVLDAGTILECDRVYVRSFSKGTLDSDRDFDSITWKVIGPSGKPLPRQRFWVKLYQCNQIEYSETSTYRDRVKLARLVMES